MDLDDKKLLIEWKKLSKSGIFANIEEFAQYYYSHGEKQCYRKYSAYPWCPDNFFFGTYAELRKFYETTSEIPFYLKSKIGTKQYSLIINDICRNENNELIAKCTCDCGNQKEILLKPLLKGNIRSCGCKHFRVDEGTNSLQVMRPEILVHWDYTHNSILPTTLGLKSQNKVWWICEKCGAVSRNRLSRI